MCKVTTASTEGAEPYTSTGDIYLGRYLPDDSARSKEFAGATVLTAHATAVNEWLLAVQTPFGHWEGVAFYDWWKPDIDSDFFAYQFEGEVNDNKATRALAYAEALANLKADAASEIPVYTYARSFNYMAENGGL
jgi:hypothetical protein